MASAQVELIRRGLAVWSGGDIDEMLALLDENVEHVPAGTLPGGAGCYFGHDGYRRFFAEFRDPWAELEIVAERAVEAPDQVVVYARFRAVGRDSVEVRRSFGMWAHLRNGRAPRMQIFPSGDEAL